MTDPADSAPAVLPTRPQIQFLASGRLRVCAAAKLNLNLLVGPRGRDGYHPLDSLVAKVSLYDRIDLSPRHDGRITMASSGLDCGDDADNLALRAAQLLGQRFPGRGVDIVLEKLIPPGRGLGGGASDAAAVLIGLNELWRLGASVDELAALGGQLGSDVPIFFGPAAARMRGRGERIAPADVHPFVAVLLMPDFACRTSTVYDAYDESPKPIGSQLPAELLADPPSAWRSRLSNDLAEPARRAYPALAKLWPQVTGAASGPVHLTGSGSAMFILCDDAASARAAAADLLHLPVTPCLVTLNSW